MKGGIMQPYFFPYIGYYQLAYDVKKYVFLDDVTFIKQGYINRNSILLQGKRHEFTLPVNNISSFRNINEHAYQENFSKFLKLLDSAYKKAPFFDVVMPLIESIVLDGNINVAQKNAKSLTQVFEYLGLEREFIFASEVRGGGGKKGQERVIDICQNLGVKQYCNAIGGKDIYDAKCFNVAGIDLKFLQSKIPPYSQGKNNFISHLSIIDILMHCERGVVIKMLGDYDLVE